jgi:hypothetical protein
MEGRPQTDVAGIASVQNTPGAGWWVLVSALFLLVQVVATDYGSGNPEGTAVFWFVVGLVLLWFVYRRRSRFARGLVVVLSLTGAVVYALGALDSLRAAGLALAFLGQALPLLTNPVRRHVQEHAQQSARIAADPDV